MTLAGRWIAFWFVVVLCFVFVAYVATTGTRTSTDAESMSFVAPSPSPTTNPDVVLFVGDSYVAGSSTVTQRTTFGPRACNRLGLVCYYDGQAGTGYLAEGDDDSPGPFPQRLRADRIYSPDVVVIEGGRADLGAGPVTEAATAYFTAVRKQFRTSTVIVLEPFWNNAYPPAEVVTLRAEVEESAKAANVRYVSTENWLTDALMSKDGVTPNATGHRTLATRLVPVLRAALA